MYNLSLKKISEANLSHRIQVRCQDALKADVQNADVVTVYLSDGGNRKIHALAEQVLSHPQKRIVSYHFPLADFEKYCIKHDQSQGVNIFLYNKKA